MPGVELGPKEYLLLPGVKLGLKDHLQVSRTTAQSSLEYYSCAVVFLASRRCLGFIRRAFLYELLLCQPVRRVCVKHYKRQSCAVPFFREQLFLCLVGDIVRRSHYSVETVICVCVCERETHFPSRATLVPIQKNSYFEPSRGHLKTKTYLVKVIILGVCVSETHRLSRATLVLFT